MKKPWFIALIATVCAGILGLTFFLSVWTKPSTQPVRTSITSFAECKEAGYPIAEKYPEECRTPDGLLFLNPDEPVVEEPVATSTSPVFGRPKTLRISDTVTFPDGLSVTLKEISDSRCKPDVQCIWAGELAPLLSVTGGSYETARKEIRLGTTNNQAATVREYSFTLESATEAEITLTVSKVSSPPVSTSEVGYVVGQVTVGPICPTEQVDIPCAIPPETYTSRNVVVFAIDQKTIKKTTPLSASGKYKLALVSGIYYLQIQPAGVGPGELKKVEVNEFETSTVDFDIDTGIR